MTLRQLEVFCAVARHGSMKLACVEMKLSGGTVSLMMDQLQRDLGQDLIAQSTRNGSPLTPTGRRLFETIDPAFKTIRKAIDECKRGSHG